MGMVFVSGGSRGIGRAICEEFANCGQDVAFCYSSDEEGAEQTVRRVESLGAGAIALRCDISSEAEVEKMFAALPCPEILVNNAGISLYGEIANTSYADWNRLFSVNVGGAFLCTRALIPRFLKRGGGSIVNVSSMWGETGASCEAAYSASKAALIGFTKAAAKELAPANIRVNCVACGMVDTQMNARFSEAEKQAFVREIPTGRICTAEEVASAVAFLARSRYITGQILRQNGGAFI